EVHAGGRTDLGREERIEPIAERVRRPAEGPDRLLLIAASPGPAGCRVAPSADREDDGPEEVDEERRERPAAPAGPPPRRGRRGGGGGGGAGGAPAGSMSTSTPTGRAATNPPSREHNAPIARIDCHTDDG